MQVKLKFINFNRKIKKKVILYDFDAGDWDFAAGIINKQHKNPKSIV